MSWGWPHDPHQVEAIAVSFGALLTLIDAVGVSSREVGGWSFTSAKSMSAIGKRTRGTGGGKDNFVGCELFTPNSQGEMPVRVRFDTLDSPATNAVVSRQMWLTGAAALSVHGVGGVREVEQFIRDGPESTRTIHLPFARLLSLATSLSVMGGYGHRTGRSGFAILDIAAWVYGLKSVYRFYAPEDLIAALTSGDSIAHEEAVRILATQLARAHIVNGSVDLIIQWGNLVYSVVKGKLVTGAGLNVTCRMDAVSGGQGVVSWVTPDPLRMAFSLPRDEAAALAGACTRATHVPIVYRSSHMPEPDSEAVGRPPFHTHPEAPDVKLVALAERGGAQEPLPPSDEPPPPRALASRVATVQARRLREAEGAEGFSLHATSFLSAPYLFWPPESGGCFAGLGHGFIEAMQRYIPGTWIHVKGDRAAARHSIGNLPSKIGRCVDDDSRRPIGKYAVKLGEIAAALPDWAKSVSAGLAGAGDPPESRCEMRYIESTDVGYGGVKFPDIARFLTANMSLWNDSRRVYAFPVLRDWTLAVSSGLAVIAKACINVLRKCALSSSEQLRVVSTLRDALEYMRAGEDGRLSWRLRHLVTAYGRPVLPQLTTRLKIVLGLHPLPAAAAPAQGGADPRRAVQLRRQLQALEVDYENLAAATVLEGEDDPLGDDGGGGGGGAEEDPDFEDELRDFDFDASAALAGLQAARDGEREEAGGAAAGDGWDEDGVDVAAALRQMGLE
jgi:hypothetical protein